MRRNQKLILFLGPTTLPQRRIQRMKPTFPTILTLISSDPNQVHLLYPLYSISPEDTSISPTSSLPSPSDHRNVARGKQASHPRTWTTSDGNWVQSQMPWWPDWTPSWRWPWQCWGADSFPRTIAIAPFYLLLWLLISSFKLLSPSHGFCRFQP